ncbi:hypothetical protein KFL_000110260 [Klebsormidium nitens]|uniref:EGF-like domain-containing protein n=1 Tax=Klebsormidium nitens TaxID=105231 RepID=A0A1Y1HMB0_KLENI|nr:hypothetical protein KFL_000110260 [Klebsormidium nitens]|eukprot:GAQ78329.1 hypothetical protein KFL_000110260 [Klebsormidium nitens]
MLVCNVAAGSRVSNGVPISGRRPGLILTRNALAEIQRFLFGIIDAPVDPNPGGVAPLPGPLQSPPGYVAPATYNASIFTPPAPVASVQCDPPCLNGGVGQLSSSRGCTCKCPASDNTAGSLFFTGEQCEIPATICNQFGFYCTHGGRCPASGTGTCACQAPFYGTQCEVAGFTCGQVICQNGGKCTIDSQNQQAYCAFDAAVELHHHLTEQQLGSEMVLHLDWSGRWRRSVLRLGRGRLF